MSKSVKIAVIGAGPAGMSAAIEAARAGNQVFVLEKNKQSGKKLRITGGGRGNLSNRHVSPLQYYTKNMRFLQRFFAHLSFEDVIEYLHDLGIYTYQTEDGWVYPLSNSASNLADLLEARMKAAGAELKTGFDVSGIERKNQKFELSFSSGKLPLTCDRLIIACGGKAYPHFGSGGALMNIIRKLGHIVFPIHPALAPILLDVRPVHKLQGLRMDAGLTLWKKEDKLAETFGNIIFTSWGINGPGAMDLSHWISLYQPDDMYIEINFIKGMEEKVRDLLFADPKSEVPLGVLLGAFLQPRAVQFILGRSGSAPDREPGSFSRDEIAKLYQDIQCFRIDVKGVKGFDQCQVSTGGVTLDEIDPYTMQSLLIPGLFFAGEVMDVAGPCGGYNLHWAFASGIIAGRSCGGDLSDQQISHE